VYDSLHSQLEVAEYSGNEKRIRELLAKIHDVATKQYKIKEQISASKNIRKLENDLDVAIDNVNL
jgi:hypothetical protein